jgi:hypothetical protein
VGSILKRRPSSAHPILREDKHDTYRKKKIATAEKLKQFFGQAPPSDICLSEIEREGLKAMLQSKIPLCYFLYHLLQEYSCENLVSAQLSFT